MGVTQLWQILEPVKRRRSLKELQGMTLAVDLSAWIVDSNAVRQMQGAVVKPHLRNLFFRVQHLLQLEITPVFVLEGKAPELKLEVLAKRNQARYGSRGGGTFRARAQGNRSQLARVIRECCEMLDYLGLPYVESAGEAEAMCAFLNQETMVEACITQDGDAFLYGARTVIRNFTVTGKEPVVEIYRMDDIERTLSLNRERLVGLAILLGCDYNPKGVPGVGKEQAMKLVQGLPQHQSLLDRFSRWQSAQFMSELSREADLRPMPHCKTCGHPGSSRDHGVSGCPLCRTARHCSPSDVDSQCPCEWHQKKASVEGKAAELAICRKAGQLTNFPDRKIIDEFLRSQNRRPTKSFGWRRPDIRKLWSFNLDVLTWPETYTTEKIVPLVTLWDLRQGGTSSRTDLLPHRIVKARTRQGVPCYEVEWEKLDDDCSTESEYYTTVEEQGLFSRSYPDVLAKFEADNGKKTSKKRVKKPAKPAPELEDLADALSQSLHITAPRAVTGNSNSEKVGKAETRRTFDSDSDDNDDGKSLEAGENRLKATRWTCESLSTPLACETDRSYPSNNFGVENSPLSVSTSKCDVIRQKMTSNVSTPEKTFGKVRDDRSPSGSEDEFNIPLSQRLAMMRRKKNTEPPLNTMRSFCFEPKLVEPVTVPVSPRTKAEDEINTESGMESFVADYFVNNEEITLLDEVKVPSDAVDMNGDDGIPKMVNKDASSLNSDSRIVQEVGRTGSEKDNDISKMNSNSKESSEISNKNSVVSTIRGEDLDTAVMRDPGAGFSNLPTVKKEPNIGKPETDEEAIVSKVKEKMDTVIPRVITDIRVIKRESVETNSPKSEVGLVNGYRKKDPWRLETNASNRVMRVKMEKPETPFTGSVKTENLGEEPTQELSVPVRVKKEIVPTVAEVKIKIENKDPEVPRVKSEQLVTVLNEGKAVVPSDKIKHGTETDDLPKVKRETPDSGIIDLSVDKKPIWIATLSKPDSNDVVVKQENDCSTSTIQVKQENPTECNNLSNPQTKVLVPRIKQEHGSEPVMPVVNPKPSKKNSRLKITKEPLESQRAGEVKSASNTLVVKKEPFAINSVKEITVANVSKGVDTRETVSVKTEPLNSDVEISESVKEKEQIEQPETVKRETVLPKWEPDDYPIMMSDEETVSDYSHDSPNSDIDSTQVEYLDGQVTESPLNAVELEQDGQCSKLETEGGGGFLPDVSEFCWDDSCDNVTLVAKENVSCHGNTNESLSYHGNNDGWALVSSTDDVALSMSKSVRFKIEPTSETFSCDVIDLCDSDEDDVTNRVNDVRHADNNASKFDFPTDDIISCGGNFNDDTRVENHTNDQKIDTHADVDTVLSQTFFDRLQISENLNSDRTCSTRTLSDKTNLLSDTILSRNITEMMAEVEANVKKPKKTRKKKTKTKMAANFGLPVEPRGENSPRINGDVLSDSFISGLASETMALSDSKSMFLSSKFLSPLTPVFKPKRTRARTKAKLSSQNEPEVTTRTNNSEGTVENRVPYGNFSLMTSLLDFDATMDDSKTVSENS